MAGHWMKEAFSHNKGGLHRALGVKQGKKIPESDIERALRSKNPHLRRMAQAAKNANK